MKKLLLFCVLLLLHPLIYGQGFEVSGTVTSDDGALPGVNVVVKGTSVGTVTDIDGNYKLMVPDATTTLVYSFVGYKPKEVAVGSQTVINVVLEDDFTELSEVVVIGYGEQKKSVSTGAVASVGKEKLEGINFQSVEQTLQGQVTGVYVAPASGQPGSNQTIIIRGAGSNGDNSPLYIVDGLVTKDISNINPSDIASMEVLKDAASTAIYGARGANGVIIVTTQKGEQDKATLEYSGFIGSSKPWRLPTMMNSDQYVTAIREKFANSNSTGSLNTNFPQVGEGYNTTNWMNEVVSPALTQNHSISIGKGGDKSSYYISLGYWDQDGVVGGDKSNFKRYTARVNSKSTINKIIAIGENISITHSERKSIPENNAFGSVLADAFNYDPLTEIYTNYTDTTFGFAISPYVGKEYINPFARTFISNGFNRSDRIQGNIYAEISPIEGLTFRTDIAVDYSYTYQSAFTPKYYFRVDFQNENNEAFQGYSSGFTWQWENYVSYSKNFGSHSINAVLGISARESNSEYAGGSRQDIPFSQQLDPNWWFVSAGLESSARNYGLANPRITLQSYFARALYNYKEKYLATASIRRDGSSKFGPNNRYGIFPSFSAGWVFSEENFFNVSFINFAKFKASWGINGNDGINDLQYTSVISNERYTYQFGRPNDEVQYFGEAPIAISNPDIKWEESVQWDIGFEIDILQGKVGIDLDYYSKKTKDLLMQGVIPGLVGNNAPILNTGEMLNQGFELAINYNDEWNGLKFSGGLNLTTNKNTAVKVAGEGENPSIQGYPWPVRNFVITQMTEELPVGYFRGYKTDGIFATQADVFSYINSNGDLIQPNAQPGDIKFVDVNGDGVIDDLDITDIGKPWADLIIGMNLSFNYKGFDLRVLLNSNIGNDVYRVYERQDVSYNNYQDTWLNRWTETNTGGSYPRLVLVDNNGNQRPSDFYVEDASFLRLRNVQLGYTIPKTILDKLLIQRARFYVSFDNILTITGYSGYDPEIGTYGWILDTGIDKGFYPQNKTVGAGLNITF
ncbi:MAG: TonB-dependent receptor [Cyclobacteriaceae bacterium]|nr:TonB-dependent receptor [Cyclobacteriaceae bacterium]